MAPMLEPPEPPADVIDGERPPEIEGALSASRITLPSGARSRPLASGSCLLDVRFFRIAMFYPTFFTSEVKPAMLLTGLRLAVPARVLGGPPTVGFLTGTAFLIGINFATSIRGGGVAVLGLTLAVCNPPAGRVGRAGRGGGRFG